MIVVDTDTATGGIAPREREQEPVETHYAHVAHSFDTAAGSYDEVYQQNQVMAWMRARSLAELQKVFAPGSLLLEVGCGTGEEALALGRRGFRIVATDISPAMIEVARQKARDIGVEGVQWRVLAAGDLAQLVDEFDVGSFDGAFSSFGALNCEPQLAPVAESLACLLHPGAAFICSVMNRWCLWEIAWGLAHLRPGEAFRRLGSGWIQAGLEAPQGRLSVPTRYFNPQALAREFAPRFRFQSVQALPALLPPPYLDHLLGRYPGLFNRLEALDTRVRDRSPFHSLGDHFQLTLVRDEEEEISC